MKTDDILKAMKDRLAELDAERAKLASMIAAAEGPSVPVAAPPLFPLAPCPFPHFPPPAPVVPWHPFPGDGWAVRLGDVSPLTVGGAGVVPLTVGCTAAYPVGAPIAMPDGYLVAHNVECVASGRDLQGIGGSFIMANSAQRYGVS